MTASARAYSVAAASRAARDRPERRSRSGQAHPRAAAAKASKPWECSAMKSASRTRAPPTARGVVGGQQRLGNAHEGRDVATSLDLVVLRRDPRLRAGQHLGRRLRIGEALKPPLAQGVEGDDGNA